MIQSKQIIEFQKLPYKRDLDYFNEGYASWEVNVKNKKYYVHAIYQEQALYDNETTKDFSNGIKGFEVMNQNFNVVKQFKYKAKSPVVSLAEVEKWLLS